MNGELYKPSEDRYIRAIFGHSKWVRVASMMLRRTEDSIRNRAKILNLYGDEPETPETNKRDGQTLAIYEAVDGKLAIQIAVKLKLPESVVDAELKYLEKKKLA